MAEYSQNYDANPAVEAILVKLRASLKRRGAEGIRGLARHFKACAPLMTNLFTCLHLCSSREAAAPATRWTTS